jgi:hypothetical protein
VDVSDLVPQDDETYIVPHVLTVLTLALHVYLHRAVKSACKAGGCTTLGFGEPSLATCRELLLGGKAISSQPSPWTIL